MRAYQLTQDIWASGCIFTEMVSGKIHSFQERTLSSIPHRGWVGWRPSAADMDFPGVSQSTISCLSLHDSMECSSRNSRSPYWRMLCRTPTQSLSNTFSSFLRGILQFNPQNRLGEQSAPHVAVRDESMKILPPRRSCRKIKVNWKMSELSSHVAAPCERGCG